MTKPKLVSLRQFQRSTGISDKALIVLISQGTVPMSLENGELQIDLGSTSTDALIAASLDIHEHDLEPYRQLFVSRFAELIYDSLDELIDAALVSIPSGGKDSSSPKS